jgi:hypothetical protein
MRDGVRVARQVLALKIGVRIPVPQLTALLAFPFSMVQVIIPCELALNERDELKRILVSQPDDTPRRP